MNNIEKLVFRKLYIENIEFFIFVSPKYCYFDVKIKYQKLKVSNIRK